MGDELIDTNVLVYAYDTSDKKKHDAAKSIVKNVWANGNGVTTVQNLTEFFVVVTGKVKLPLAPHKAQVVIDDMISSDKWRIYDRDILSIPKATALSIKHGVHLWDTLTAQVMLDNRIECIITENTRDFGKTPGISAVNPFK
jgi:predicted nucleic acid-binding protein